MFRICCWRSSHAGSISCSVRYLTCLFFSPLNISTIFTPMFFSMPAEIIVSKFLRTDSRINRLTLLRSAANGTLFLGTENPISIYFSFGSVNRNPVSNVPCNETPLVMTLENDWYPRRMIDLGSVCCTYTAASWYEIGEGHRRKQDRVMIAVRRLRSIYAALLPGGLIILYVRFLLPYAHEIREYSCVCVCAAEMFVSLYLHVNKSCINYENIAGQTR